IAQRHRACTRTIVDGARNRRRARSEEHTSELQSRSDLVCRLLLEKKKPRKHDGAEELVEDRIKTGIFVFPGSNCDDDAFHVTGTFLRHQPLLFFFFNDTATTEIYTLSLHDALPIQLVALSVMGSRGMVRKYLRATRS